MNDDGNNEQRGSSPMLFVLYDRIQKIESNHESFQQQLSSDVKDIKDLMVNFPCKVHTTKIGLLEKIVFGAVGLILIAVFTNFISDNSNIGKDKNAKAEQTSLIGRGTCHHDKEDG
jgi:hypothetical protein